MATRFQDDADGGSVSPELEAKAMAVAAELCCRVVGVVREADTLPQVPTGVLEAADWVAQYNAERINAIKELLTYFPESVRPVIHGLVNAEIRGALAGCQLGLCHALEELMKK